MIDAFGVALFVQNLTSVTSISYFQEQLKYTTDQHLLLVGFDFSRIASKSTADYEQFESGGGTRNGRWLDLYRAGLQNVALGYLNQPAADNPTRTPFTFGSRTFPEDIPAGASLTYNLSAAVPPQQLSPSSIVVDTGTRSVTGSVTSTTGTLTAKLTLNGTLDLASGTISGDVTNDAGRAPASFCGWLYGDSAIEIGFVVAPKATGPASQSIFGAFAGRR